MARIDDLIEQLRVIEAEVQVEVDHKREDFRSAVDDQRALFSRDVAQLQRSKVELGRYLSRDTLVAWIAAPLIYLALPLLAVLDLFLFGYQALVFPAYRIPKARRSDYIVLDRGDLPYLNGFEKVACVYCGYANGLASYFREIAARTEQYFCPIKHARKVLAAHDRYPGFFEFGDAESYRLGLERLRAGMDEADRS